MSERMSGFEYAAQWPYRDLPHPNHICTCGQVMLRAPWPPSDEAPPKAYCVNVICQHVHPNPPMRSGGEKLQPISAITETGA